MALCVAIAASVIGAGRMTADTRDVAVRTNAPTVSRASYGMLPLGFERNHGQSDAKVDFLARGRGYSLFLTSNEAVIAVGGGTHADGSRQHALLRMTLVNASRGSRATGADELPAKSHYLIGSDPAKWRTNISSYGRVTYVGVYPGIDLVYYGNQGQLEYDFIVAPGIDPGLITLAFQGARDVQIDGRGELVLHVEGGELRQRKPVVYQEIAGLRREVPGVYVLRQANQIGFAIAAYDTTRPLIIDPVLVYSTYLGGGGFDHGHDVVVDAAGNAYVTGYAGAVNFPTTPGAAQTTKAGGFSDAFVTKLDPTGSVLLYSTYLGGSDLDYARSIAVDAAGNAYVAGHTASTNFPTTQGAFQTTTNGGGIDGFLAKLDPSGSTLVYSTYLGGSGADSSLDIALDGAGSTYVTGSTGSIDFPTTSGAAQATLAGSTDAFVAKLNATGSALVYSTYVGGAAGDFGTSIAVDGSGRAHVAGSSASSDFPATAGAAQTTNAGGNDAFVTTLNATGSVLLSSTYLGGSAADRALGIALDGAGNAYVTGSTASSDFPTTVSAAQTTYAGGRDAFVTKLDATQSARLYSTYLGGAGGDDGNNIAVSGAGSAYVTGVTLSTDFPLTPDAVQTTSAGQEGFVTKVSASGSALDYSTYLGGNSSDFGFGIFVDSAGDAYVTGDTFSTTFPTTPGAVQPTNGGILDAFVAKIEFVKPPASLTLAPAVAANPVSTQHCVTATVRDAVGNPSPNIVVRFSVTGAIGTNGSATTNSNGQATFCYVGPTTPGSDAIAAYADTNANITQDAGEPGGTAAKTWIAGAPATLMLSPATASNPVNTQHCVTATVQDAFGNPTPVIIVRFSVAGAVVTSGSAVTNAGGQAVFCYTGPTTAGVDAITAFGDTNNNTAADGGEPSGTGTKSWFVPLPTSKDQCKDGGWKAFGVFKNQGDCVSFVATNGKNGPGLP